MAKGDGLFSRVQLPFIWTKVIEVFWIVLTYVVQIAHDGLDPAFTSRQVLLILTRFGHYHLVAQSVLADAHLEVISCPRHFRVDCFSDYCERRFLLLFPQKEEQQKGRKRRKAANTRSNRLVRQQTARDLLSHARPRYNCALR
jgi:hypothetical protein